MNAARRFTRFVCLLSAAVCSVTNYADTLNVPNPYPNLSAAIAAANPGDTIIVANGTYTGPGNKNLVLNNKDITIQSESRDPNQCTINCADSGRAFSFSNGDGSIIDGFTIRLGNSTYGGVAYIDRSSPTLRNCILTNNVATENGGAVHMVFPSSAPRFVDCLFTNNQAVAGGAVSAYDNCDPVFENCEFRANHASANGGALQLYYSCHPTLVNCVIADNTAGGEGGGGYFQGGATLRRCRISGNSAGEAAGGVSADYSLYMSACLIEGNSAGSTWAGGGVYYSDPGASNPGYITSCLITGNASGWAGGLYVVTGGGKRITNCTITNNHASTTTGGIYGANATVTNCIVRGNSTPQITALTSSVSYSDVEGGFAGVGNFDLDPLFADADGLDDDPNTWADNDFHITAGSPCLEAGDNHAPYLLGPDFDRNPRRMDADYDEEEPGVWDTVDVGADEFPGDWYENFDDNEIGDWLFENPCIDGDSPVTMGLSTAQYTSASYGMYVTGSNQDFYGGFAHGPELGLPATAPYMIKFQFRYHQFHWYHLLLIGPVQLTMDYPSIKLRYRDDGPTWSYLGTASFGSYCPQDTWTEFQIDVNPPTHTYDVYVDGVFRGRADYQSFVTSEDGFGFAETGGDAPGDPDFIADGYYDDLAVTAGGWHDCNGNGAPDGGDIAGGTSQDCNGNGTPDECEPDCNGNSVPDSCDLTNGTSEDCNENEVPDECDIASGYSQDANGNGVPDECDPPPSCRADMNCDGTVGFGDINPFVLYLSNFSAWQTNYPGCNPANGDINQNGIYPSFGDINAFVGLLSTSPIPQCQ